VHSVAPDPAAWAVKLNIDKCRDVSPHLIDYSEAAGTHPERLDSPHDTIVAIFPYYFFKNRVAIYLFPILD
jgi:hypothetical protein